VRIIAGSFKGRRLQAPPPGVLAVRPTSDRSREALFSILDPCPRGPFLDLFAGTGAVGLEARSRGHHPVTCVENAPGALRLLRTNTAGTDLQIVAADALRMKADAFAGLGLVFADPPYSDAGRVLVGMASRIRGWLAPEGLLIWECSALEELLLPVGFHRTDQRRYGAAAFHFLVRST
jgi:16S rRNA (guanine966-N2)-methyltransferase